jgi:hypothetical protein
MAAHPPPPWSATPLTIQHLLFDWSFAVNSLFRLFGDVRFSGTHAQVAAHPPLPIRRMMVAVTADKLTQSEADQTMESNLGKPGTNWVHTFRKAILETELAFMMITGQERSGFGLQDVFSRDGIDYANRLWSLWHGTMSGRLRPYSYEAHRPAVQ